MNNRAKLINDYVDSLECNQLNEGQEALLLVGQSNELFGEGNGSCKNRAKSCDFSINDFGCSNKNASGCQGSIGGRKRKTKKVVIPLLTY